MIKVETNAEYHSNKNAISKSQLAKMKVNPKYFLYCLENNEKKKTDEMVLGSAFHKLVLEEEDFYNEFYVHKPFDRRTKEGKEYYEKTLLESNGKELISEDVFRKISEMKESLQSNHYAIKMLSKGDAEKSIYFNDPVTNIECKCRPDFLRGLGDKKLIVDLKTCVSASADKIAKSIVDFDYDLQAYMYSLGTSLEYNIPIEDVQFVFMFIEKEPPYNVHIGQADEFILLRGKESFRKYIGQLKECRDSGVYYDYNGFSGQPSLFSLPAYLLKNYNN